MRRKQIMMIVIGVVGGGVLGYLYYKFAGCASGTCPITRNPYISTIYGALIGLLLTMGIQSK